MAGEPANIGSGEAVRGSITGAADGSHSTSVRAKATSANTSTATHSTKTTTRRDIIRHPPLPRRERRRYAMPAADPADRVVAGHFLQPSGNIRKQKNRRRYAVTGCMRRHEPVT